jgi:hypothetical protein
MKGFLRLFLIVMSGVFILFQGGALCANESRSVETKRIVARVNGESITEEEFYREAVSLHSGQTGAKSARKQAESKLLERLVNARLMGQEARRMGFDQLPEIKSQVDGFAKVTLRETLMQRHVKNVRPRASEVERLYLESTTEWRVSSLLFEKELDANQVLDEWKSGKTFEDLVSKAVATGVAKSEGTSPYLKLKDISPDIRRAVSGIKQGSPSPVIPLKSGYALVKLEDVRISDLPEEKERARHDAVRDERLRLLKEYSSVLAKKYVKVHKEVLDKINYESRESQFEDLLRDTRVVADVQGEAPITVGELTSQLKQQFYHGVDKAIESKKLNAKKEPTLDEMIYKRVLRKEALRLGLDKTPDYKSKVKDYENSLVFGAFIQKAVASEVKITEDEVRTYYDTHVGEYTFPEMARIFGLAFVTRTDAEGAIEKLRAGTNYQWLVANAEGQADKNAKGLLLFDGSLLTTPDLPEGVKKSVSGSKSGDLRLYAAPEGTFYVLSIQEVVPAKPKPYEQTREEIAKKIFDEKMKKALDEYVSKLRAAANIKIYLKP